MLRVILVSFAASLYACAFGAKVAEPAASSPEPSSAAVDEPGERCVGDPWSHAVRYLVEHRGDALERESGQRPTLADFDAPGAWCTAVTSLADLDGDGAEEVVVEQCYGSYAAVHLIYLSNHGCTQFGSELLAGPLEPMDSETNGLRDLEATWSNGCAGNNFEWTRYAWSGADYEVVDTATCEFCEEDPPEPGPELNAHPTCQREARDRG